MRSPTPRHSKWGPSIGSEGPSELQGLVILGSFLDAESQAPAPDSRVRPCILTRPAGESRGTRLFEKHCSKMPGEVTGPVLEGQGFISLVF